MQKPGCTFFMRVFYSALECSSSHSDVSLSCTMRGYIAKLSLKDTCAFLRWYIHRFVFAECIPRFCRYYFIDSTAQTINWSEIHFPTSKNTFVFIFCWGVVCGKNTGEFSEWWHHLPFHPPELKTCSPADVILSHNLIFHCVSDFFTGRGVKWTIPGTCFVA